MSLPDGQVRSVGLFRVRGVGSDVWDAHATGIRMGANPRLVIYVLGAVMSVIYVPVHLIKYIKNKEAVSAEVQSKPQRWQCS